MAAKPLDPKLIAEAVELVEKHGSIAAASRATGIERTTLSHRYNLSRKRGQVSPEAAGQINNMRESSLESQVISMQRKLAEMEAARSPKRVPMESSAEPPTDAAQAWLAAEIDSAKRIAYAKERSRFRVSFDDGPIAVAFISDQHISPGNTVDFARMRADAELIRDTPNLYCCLGGDGVDNHILIRSAMMAARSQPHDQYKLYNYYLGILAEKVMAVISGNHDCLDDTTEGLTRRGWMSYRQIRDDDEVLGINPATGAAEWQAIEKRIVQPFDGELNRLQTNCIDILCTDKHRILHKPRHGGLTASQSKFTFTRAMEFTRGGHFVPVAATSVNPEFPIKDDEIRVAALLLTDGWIATFKHSTHRSINFAQRESNADSITSVLDRLGYEYTVRTRHRNILQVCGRELVKPVEPQCEIRLKADSSRRVFEYIDHKKKLPSWVEKLSQRQYAVFLDSLIEGDGSYATGSTNSSVLHGTKDFLEQVQIASIQHGHSAYLIEYRPGTWRLNLCCRDFHRIDAVGKWSRERYTGDVWCLTVPQGNFLIRRNGKCHFTGNSWTDQVAGIDMISNLAEANRLCYSPAEARIDCTVGGQLYKIAMRHQYRFNSSFNMLHAVKQWYRMGEEAFDIGVICHHHEPEVGTFESHGMTRWAARPGAYQISSSYTRQYGWNSTYPTCPTFVLMPGQREVVPFQDMRRAADYLTKLRTP